MKKEIFTASLALLATLSAQADNPYVEVLADKRVDSESLLPAKEVPAEVMNVYNSVMALDTSAFNRLVDEYRISNYGWPTDMAHRALLVAASYGHIGAQIELVKCFAEGEYGAGNNWDAARAWLEIVLKSDNVDALKSFQAYEKEHRIYVVDRYTLDKRVKDLEAGKKEAPAQPTANDADPNATTSVVEEEKMKVLNPNGTLTDEFVNALVEKRMSLYTTNDPTDDLFSSIYDSEVLNIKKSVMVSRADLVKRARTLYEQWPTRVVKVLSVGVSGLKVEINALLAFNGPNDKKINAFNKITLLVNDEGIVVGMNENTTQGSAPKLTPEFKKFPYSGANKFVTAE